MGFLHLVYVPLEYDDELADGQRSRHPNSGDRLYLTPCIDVGTVTV